MFFTITTLISSGLSYLRGRATGLIGLFFIGLTIFAIYKWEYIHKFLEWTGIWGFFENIGVIEPGTVYPTGSLVFFLTVVPIVIVAFIAVVFLVFVIVMFVFAALHEILGDKIFWGLITVLFFPLILIFMLLVWIHDKLKYAFNSEYRREIIEKRKLETYMRENPPARRLIKEECVPISHKEAETRLNRLPTYGDDAFLVGTTENDIQHIYVLIPRPLHTYKALFVPVVKCRVRDWEKRESSKTALDRKYFINFDDDDMLEFASLYRFEQIYETTSSDLKGTFRVIKALNPYKEYVKQTQDDYFKNKERLLNKIKNIDISDTEKYERLTSLLKTYDAINEEIVRIMRDSVISQEG